MGEGTIKVVSRVPVGWVHGIPAGRDPVEPVNPGSERLPLWLRLLVRGYLPQLDSSWRRQFFASHRASSVSEQTTASYGADIRGLGVFAEGGLSRRAGSRTNLLLWAL